MRLVSIQPNTHLPQHCPPISTHTPSMSLGHATNVCCDTPANRGNDHVSVDLDLPKTCGHARAHIDAGLLAHVCAPIGKKCVWQYMYRVNVSNWFDIVHDTRPNLRWLCVHIDRNHAYFMRQHNFNICIGMESHTRMRPYDFISSASIRCNKYAIFA